MPRHVDHEDRRRQIIQATLNILAEQGPSGLTFRAVAKRMGGSSTLVTHYFPTRQDLLDALVADYVSEWPAELADLEKDADDPRVRLRLFLRWMLPADEKGLVEEQGRINLIGERDTQLRTQHIFDAWDANVRKLMAQHVDGLVDAERVPAVIDLLRVVTNGITLATVEHPGEWPPERQFAVLDDALAAMDLLPAATRAA